MTGRTTAYRAAKPWLDDGDLQLYHGDVLAVLQGLPAGIAQTCVTSPPYWGLRDYGTGDAQLGLEATPDQYVAKMVEVFREVRRVLRDDGTLWLNIGDSYNANQGAGFNAHRDTRPHLSGEGVGQKRIDAANRNTAMPRPPGLKPKDLVGIPWRLAFALQADGWYLRSDIIWAKPNPMPESVTDRPTKAHEYVFLFSKQPRYYWDADAVREPSDHPHLAGKLQKVSYHDDSAMRNDGDSVAVRTAARNLRSVWQIATQPFPEAHFATYPEALVERCIKAGSRDGDLVLDPFIGSGTTAAVARRHGRRSIGIDLSADYLSIAAKRTQQLSLLGIDHEPATPAARSRGLTGGAYSPPGQTPHSNARGDAA